MHINKSGKFEAHGHWDPCQVLINDTYRDEIHEKQYVKNQFAWRGNWEQTIRNHTSKLVPKPHYVVINAGAWPHDLLKIDTLANIRQALDDNEMIGIYKTTTKKIDDTSTTLVKHDIEGCRHLHFCMDLSWTGNITDPEEFVDKAHFRANVKRKFNEQFLDLLQNIPKEYRGA